MTILGVMLLRALIIAVSLTGSLYAWAAEELPGLRFVHMFGELGEDPGSFLWSSGLDNLSDGRLAIFDSTRVQLCTPAGECELFGSQGSETGQFALNGGSLAVDSADFMYVADTENWRVQRCDTAGSCTIFGPPGYDDETKEGFWRPVSVDVDKFDQVWVGSSLHHRVQRCDQLGQCVVFGEPYQLCAGDICTEQSFYESRPILNKPTRVHVDRFGRVFVSQEAFGDNSILVCDQAPIPRCFELGPRIGGTDPGQFNNPTNMDSDSLGRLFVVDNSNARIQVCDVGSGQCRVSGSRGTGPGQFDQLTDITVLDDEAVATTEYATRRVQLFRVEEPGPFQINAGLSDAWFNPVTDGQGFFITVLPKSGQMAVAWFTFETQSRPPDPPPANVGEPFHRWLTAAGGWEGNIAQLDVTMTAGGILDDPAPVEYSPQGTYGSIRIEFHDCRSATLSYDLHALGLAGEIPLMRIVGDNARLCEVMDYP